MANTSRIVFPLLALCLLAAAVFLTLALLSPPEPQPADAPATVFSAERAMRDLSIIAQEPHPMGVSPAHAALRDYLLGEIRALGLQPQVQATFGTRLVYPGAFLGGWVENILVRLPGIDPEGAILLSSHYDSTPGGPGGADSGSGIVTILELLRALQAGPPLRQDIIFFFSDGEEPGTIGAHAFVAQHPWFRDVRFVINIDQVKEGPPMLFHSSQRNGALIQAVSQSAAATRPAHISFPFHLFPSGDTDLLPFELAGLPGAEISSGGSFPEKHTALDRPEVVDPASLQYAGDQILALLRYMGDHPMPDWGTPDETFFPILGTLVHYPASIAGLFAALATLSFLGSIFVGFRKNKLTWRGLGLGFLAILFVLSISVIAANLVWLGIQALHPEYAYVSEYSFRQKLSDDYLYAIGLILLTLSVCTTTIASVRKTTAAHDLVAGSLAIWLPLTIAGTILLPATSYLFTWTLLAGSLALLLSLMIPPINGAWLVSGIGFLFCAILATFLWVPLFYVAILAGPVGSGSLMLSLLVLSSALWMGSMMSILDWIGGLNRGLLPAASLLAALGLLLAGHFLAGKDSPPPLVNPIGYWLEADKGTAYWISFSEELDQRQANLLVEPERRSYNELLSEAPLYSVVTSPAPIMDLDGPRLDVLQDEWRQDRRTIAIKFMTSMHDRLYIIIPKESPMLAVTVPDRERIELPAVENRGWVFRFDGCPEEGFVMRFEFLGAGPVEFLIVEEKTGVPVFPGLSTQPQPGTMKSPGEFYQGIPTDFTAINRDFLLPGIGP